MKKLYAWIVKHKILTLIICAAIFALPLVIVHVLYKLHLGISCLVSEWGAGDIILYVAGFEAFLGTVFLGLVSLEQSRKAEETNERLSKENNELQKIMSQRLIPVIEACSVKTTPTDKHFLHKDSPGIQSFTRQTHFSQVIGYEFVVNIDVDNNNEKAYKKELSFSIKNISESMLRHICIDGIVVQGYKDFFSPIICSNQTNGNGISALLKAYDSLKVKMTFYFNDEKINEAWSRVTGGLSVILYLTNTSISGIVFHEYIEISISDNGREILTYGEGTFEERKENNA